MNPLLTAQTGLGEGPLLWYLNRATGITLLVLLTATTVLGVLSVGGRPARGLPRFVTQHLHRHLALLAVVALVVHVVTAVADTFVDIRWWQAFVPVGSAYEPLWLGLGTLSLDVMLVIVATSLLRTRLPHHAWRAVHHAAWVCWLLGVVHGVGIGTDLQELDPWAVWPTATCVGAVIAAAAVRATRSAEDDVEPASALVRSAS